jgi:RNA polymerase subunit RPABC4/transcription elongation factor Spt4
MTTQLSMFGAHYDGKQGDLLAGSATLPASKPLSDVAQISTHAAPEGVALHDRPTIHTTLATQTGSSILSHPGAFLCPECGDPVPPKAKACPNCYTRSEHYNAIDMACVIWADTLAQSEGR